VARLAQESRDAIAGVAAQAKAQAAARSA